LNFGNVVVGSSFSKALTIKNVTTATITLTNITGSGYFTVSAGGTNPCSGPLSAGKTCTATVTYKPLVAGSNIGGITVIDNASVSTQVENAAGTGILAVTAAPSTISFGTVAVGSTSAVQVVTLTNFLTTAVSLTSVVASGDFIATSGGGVPCGANIPANGICTLGVQFSPTVTGAISGNLTVIDGTATSPQIVSLSGTGQ
jgi:hypothetical protein